jgi:RNA polymerase sigma factor (sigma-70 family)
MPMTPEESKRARLREYIETEAASLRSTLRMYVLRGGLAQGGALDGAADDLLQDVIVEALRHASRLDPERSIRAWLLGIAANLVRRRQVERARREQREPLVRDLFPRWQDASDDDALFERVAALTVPLDGDPDAVDNLLQLVTPADRQVLRMAIIHEMQGEALGRALGIKAGAARVRLHRAMQRLRAAYMEHQRREGEA